jgi:hypothetical protein
MLGTKKGKSQAERPSALTVDNDMVGKTVAEHGEPSRTKTHGPDKTVLYYDEEDQSERDAPGVKTPGELLAIESRSGLMSPDTMAQATAQGLRDRERRNMEEGRPMNQPRSRAYLESIQVTEERLRREGSATSTPSTSEPTSTPVSASDEVPEDLRSQIKATDSGYYEVYDSVGNLVDRAEDLGHAIRLAQASRV